MYDSAVAYADTEVGRLIDHLAGLGLRGRTVLIVTSDHGEALGEDDRAGHSYLEDYNLLVPLLIELPDGRGAGARIDRQVRLTDLAPTILDAVGLGPRFGDDGVSLLHLIDGASPQVPDEAWTYAPSSNRGLALRLAGRLKYCFNDTAWRQLHGEERLVDLELDPAERHDRAARDPRTPGFRALVGSALLDQHRGPRITIRNAGPGMLRGKLRGAFAAHDRVKAARLGGVVRWESSTAPTFFVGAAQELTLLLSSPDQRPGRPQRPPGVSRGPPQRQSRRVVRPLAPRAATRDRARRQRDLAANRGSGRASSDRIHGVVGGRRPGSHGRSRTRPRRARPAAGARLSGVNATNVTADPSETGGHYAGGAVARRGRTT